MTNDELDEWLGYQADAKAEMALFDGLPAFIRRRIAACRFPWNLRQIAEAYDGVEFVEHVAGIPAYEDQIIREEGGMIELEPVQ